MNISKSIIFTSNTALQNRSVMVSRMDTFRHLQRRNESTTITHIPTFDMKKERENFVNSLPETIDCHLSRSKLNAVREVGDRVKLVINENVAGGKFFRGLATILAYKSIEMPKNITEESLRITQNLGWCTEMLHTYYILLDDIMDNSKTRRGKPCWYLRPETGVEIAINDALFVHSFLLEMLKTNVGNAHNYSHFVDAFNETTLYTSTGQYLDVVTGKRNQDYSLFTAERHEAIVKYKTAYYSYKLPITLGLLLANKMDEETSKILDDISLDLGRLFQIQDDYIDCFGDESLTGKLGTDIQEGKCSWLAVKALERCTRRQLTVFTSCYGSREPAHIERVKQLYKELHLPQCYKEEEKKIYNNLLEKIKIVNFEGLRNVFLKLLDVTYKRNA